MRGSEEGVSGTVLHRLIQEQLRYGNGGTRGEENDTLSAGGPASTENLLLQEEGHAAPPYPVTPPQTQSRQEPQGQEHQVDSSSMEKNGGGGQSVCRDAQTSLTLPGHSDQGLPSYEEAKIQSQLYKGQQNQLEPQQQNPIHPNPNNQIQTHQNQTHHNQTLQSQILQRQNELHPVTAQSTVCVSAGSCASITFSSSPSPLSSAASISSPPSLSSSPSPVSAMPAKARTEGRAWVPRVCVGGVPLRDEGLAELKQGHVRSLSERLMQLTLERNGVKHGGELSDAASDPGENAARPGAESAATRSPPSSGKATKNALPPPPPPPPPPPSQKGLADPRGPPPEYPFKPRAPPSSPAPLTQEHALQIYSDTLTAAVFETVPQSEIMRPYPPSVGGLSHQLLQQHSPMSSQASTPPAMLPSQASLLQPQASYHQALAGSPVQGLAVRVAPLGQPFPGEAFAIVGRAQQLLEVLNEENRNLRQELQNHTEKSNKLQRLEAEVGRLAEAYESLVRSSSKRESLDKTMRSKLEGEIRRLHDFNRDLRDRLETANRQLASQELDGQEDGQLLLSRRESMKEIEKLECEAASLRSANEDQRRHIEILEQALKNTQSRVVKLEEELGKKQVYVDRVERLQQALAQLQTACEKREQLERRLRTRLERELESLRTQQRAGMGVCSPVCESSAPALLDLLREREERILGLEADMTRWEQKYLEESAMRHFAMEAAATAAAQRDTTIIQHSRSGSYSHSTLRQPDSDEKLQNSQRAQDMEQRMKDLHAQLLEKNAMIEVLQQRSRKDSTPLRPARSVPSISIATGLHTRQTSQTDRREENSWKGSASVLMGKDSVEHSSPSSLPPLPPASAASSLPCTPLLSLHSKSASRDSSTQTGRSPELLRATPTLGRARPGKTDSPSTLTKPTESRPALIQGQRVPLPDSDLVEILI
ncbi:angiomotin-like protein 1 [Chanos chanos]|uniref:Angiomotin-like protein 1 n=1 Tax=Chanos chanos TaxID=29144 RepID=A0A6J2VLC8_CHACN|nr:angiomotin-like protein 1 [Chanos chanos]